MLTQQTIFYQLSHLPSPRKSFHTYNGSTLVQIYFIYNIRRKPAQDLESDALRLQGNPSLLASEALTPPVTALKAAVLPMAFSNVYKQGAGESHLI